MPRYGFLGPEEQGQLIETIKASIPWLWLNLRPQRPMPICGGRLMSLQLAAWCFFLGSQVCGYAFSAVTAQDADPLLKRGVRSAFWFVRLLPPPWCSRDSTLAWRLAALPR